MDYQVPGESKENIDLPQCKIKRNYSCSLCPYFTQNPRFYLTHLRDSHGEKITINNCSLCLYASRHYQKLMRHMKMVHGSTTDEIPVQARKRPLTEDVFSDLISLPPLPSPPKCIIDIDSLSYDLKSSRKTLRDIAAIYFAENEIEDIMTKMEASDVVEVVPEQSNVLMCMEVSGKTVFGDPKLFEDNLSIICDCGYISNCFSESIVHEKSCSLSYEQNKNTPLDLSIKSNIDDRTNYNQMDFNYQRKNETAVEDSSILKGILMNIKDDFEQLQSSHIKTETQDISEIETSVITPKEETDLPVYKKVFKCPRCSFWACTASRFHVHIVGHQNKKPFKCSLCAYRSNWRWDITKHIRLRTIRSPSHKNARVLMHGDTDGSRNYGKYNSCITLMNVSDQDGDVKFKKCGEMISNGNYDCMKDSSDLDKVDFDKEQVPKGEKQEKDFNFNIFADGDLGISIDAANTSKDILCTEQNNNHSQTGLKRCRPCDYLSMEVGDKPLYKCNKCNFKHSNRDAVLVHVKIKHQNDLQNSLTSSKTIINPSSSLELTKREYNKNTNSECCQDSKINQSVEVEIFPEIKRSTSFDKESVTDNVENNCKTIVSSSIDSAIEKPVSSIGSNSASKSYSKSNKCKTISVIDIATDQINPTAKALAPYRCWHCHQVSNWKHVIQRHCRLKHFGSIRIEAIDRSIDGKHQIYKMLDFSSNNETLNVQFENNKDKICTSQVKIETAACSLYSDKKLSTEMLKITLKDSKEEEKNASTHLKSVQLNCNFCPYVSTNKLDLNKHIKTHESSNNTVSKKSLDISVMTTSERNNKFSVKTSSIEKCPYCSFESSCHSAMKCHEQSHYRVLKRSQAESEFQCLKKISREKSSRDHVNKITSTANSIECPDTTTLMTKKEKPTLIENTIASKYDSNINSRFKTVEKELIKKIQQSKTSITSSSPCKKTALMLPPLSSQTTIFVNPKTGQIVRKN